MGKKERNRHVLPEDCEVYAVLPGSKKIIKLSDSSDIATDQQVSPVTVSPKNNDKESYEFIPRGRNNNMMFNIMKKIGSNVTVGSNVEFKTKIAFGDSLVVYRKYRDPHTRKIVKEEVLESEYPEIFEFLENNNYDFIRGEIANDLSIFSDSYVEYIFNKEDQPKIVQIRALESCLSRITKIDEKTGKSEYHGYSAEWDKGTPTDVVVTPLLDRQTALRDLKVRMGLLPNDIGECIIGGQRRFVHNLRLPTPGRFYYSRPYWWSAFVSGWYDFSSSIPLFKKSLLKNQMALRYTVFIHTTFWAKLFSSEKITEDEKKIARKKKFLQELNDFLSGEENAGKSFVSEFDYDRLKGYAEKDILIEAVKSSIEGGEYIEDSEECSNTLCYAQGIHPSIIGSAPGKGKSINGTEARELFTIQQVLSKSVQDTTLAPLYIAKAINKWPADIFFSVANLQLTTLDKGTGATKNTGIKKETEE